MVSWVSLAAYAASSPSSPPRSKPGSLVNGFALKRLWIDTSTDSRLRAGDQGLPEKVPRVDRQTLPPA